jgi:hypothetical protein
MKKVAIAFVLAVFVSTSAQAAETVKVKLELNCSPTAMYRTIVVPEGKRASNFRLIKYERGSECMPKFPEDNPKTELHDEHKDAIEKWEKRDPVLYGWGIRGPKGYFYSLRLLRGFPDKPVGNYGSLKLGPGKYTVELLGNRRDSSLELSYILEPYTSEGAKKPAAAAAPAAPAAAGTVEKPHKPHPSGGTETISGGKWAGTWYTHPGTIVLKQSGSHVSGTYTLQSGKVSGKIVGNTIVGTWSDGPTYKPPMDAGQIVYKMAPDGKSFSVDFRGGYDKDNLPWFRNAWKATRTP